MENKPVENKIDLLKFKSSAERMRSASMYKESRTDRLSFGVPFLDDVTNGIGKRDLIVIGGKTGVGKTQLATLIAETNAVKGKKVHLFALEAAEEEIENRIVFRSLIKILKTTFVKSAVQLNYKDWLDGYLKDVEPYEAEAFQMTAQNYETLQIRYRDEEYTVENLEKDILSIQDVTDLIILDHLHFIDYDDENDNRAIKKIIKKLRSIALDIKKPVIAFAHFRKADKKNETLTPSIDEFHGSSDITKMCTTAITIAPGTGVTVTDKYLIPTLMRVVKCREDGARTRYVSCNFFNYRVNAYEEEYRLGIISECLIKFEETRDLPHWYKRKKEGII